MIILQTVFGTTAETPTLPLIFYRSWLLTAGQSGIRYKIWTFYKFLVKFPKELLFLRIGGIVYLLPFSHTKFSVPKL